MEKNTKGNEELNLINDYRSKHNLRPLTGIRIVTGKQIGRAHV